jgi:hypothetical protein
MRFLRTKPRGVGSAYEILGIQKELERRGFAAYDQISSSFVYFLARAAGKSRVNVLFNPFPREPMIVVGGGIPDATCFPMSLWTRFIPYFFDCWEPAFSRWESFFMRNRTELAFLTARDSAKYFQQRFPSRRFLWLAESVDPSAYRSGVSLVDRSIDVLELGRKYDAFHNRLTPALADSGMSHLYEEIKGKIIFPTRTDLVSGLANSRVSICFPQSITNPERCGKVETVTLRYFESMASKCLLVGKCPLELRDLFGYTPVVEVDDAAEVVDIIRRIADHQPLVDRNYQRLLEVGTHSVRVDSLVAELRATGFSLPWLI